MIFIHLTIGASDSTNTGCLLVHIVLYRYGTKEHKLFKVTSSIATTHNALMLPQQLQIMLKF